MKFRTRAVRALIALVTIVGVQPCFGQVCTDPALCGDWEDPHDLKPESFTTSMQAIHSILVPRAGGVVLCVDHRDLDANTPDIVLVDPTTGTVSLVLNDEPYGHNLYCAGHALLPDGRVFFSGGRDECPGMNETTIFDTFSTTTDPDPEEDDWFLPGPAEVWPPYNQGFYTGTWRWYPTCTTLADGKILVTDGWCDDEPPDPPLPSDHYGNGGIPAVLQPNGGVPSTWTWRPLYDAEYNAQPNLAPYHFDVAYYPFMFVHPDGGVAYAGSNYAKPGTARNMMTRVLDTSLETWTDADTPDEGDDWVKGGSAVMYSRDYILKAGGILSNYVNACTEVSIVDHVWRGLLKDGTIYWTQKAHMVHPRHHLHLVALPDGKILALGGISEVPSGGGCLLANAVLAPEIYDPIGDDWTEMAATTIPRAHHSSVVLLPDGSVFTAGGQMDVTDPTHITKEQQRKYQIYKPPYFFQGTRPVISGGPEETVKYDSAFDIETSSASAVTAVRIVRPGADTHSFDQSQRCMNLGFTVVDSNTLRIAAPKHGYEAPPGYYLLFIATGTNGSLPSEGKFIRITPPS